MATSADRPGFADCRTGPYLRANGTSDYSIEVRASWTR
jgi:hypothetical protein